MRITASVATAGGAYPTGLLLDVASFELQSVLMLAVFEELDLFDNVLPLLQRLGDGMSSDTNMEGNNLNHSNHTNVREQLPRSHQ